MNTVEVTSVILAGVSMLGTISSALILAFRIGRLVGTVQSLVTQGGTERELQRQEISHVAAQLDRHEMWHMGPGPGGFQVKQP